MKTTSVFAKLLKLIRRVKKKEVKSELNIRCSFFKIQKATLKQKKGYLLLIVAKLLQILPKHTETRMTT